ncbi:MAG: polysaccharide deacetylase family protein [Saprospiraceae bacterium]|nr:polysaccharide deacetylase family protein [Saprospiraceae bacterium]MBK9727468.1 polysaccharide deacetylase family protein [Saprospiraceae bacterium]
MYLSFTPRFLQNMFSDLIWRVDSQEADIYLTFDDGPIPVVTPWVLKQLEQYHAKASFFCVGQNIEKHPQIFKQIIESGHSIGSHTYNHLSGWKTDNLVYLNNVKKAAAISGSKLFRPPYGRLRPSQTRLLKHHYKIIMWDVLSGDFDPHISAEDCFQNVLKNTKPGSIIVFHDSLKSAEKLYAVLPQVLEYYTLQGYTFKALDHRILSPATQDLVYSMAGL